MATFQELSDLLTGTIASGSLRAKAAVAASSKATAIVGEAAPTATRLAWAQDMLRSQPEHLVDELFRYTIMINASATIASIIGAGDVAIQANVDTAVDKLYP